VLLKREGRNIFGGTPRKIDSNLCEQKKEVSAAGKVLADDSKKRSPKKRNLSAVC